MQSCGLRCGLRSCTEKKKWTLDIALSQYQIPRIHPPHSTRFCTPRIGKMSSFRKRNVVISKKGEAPATSSTQKQSIPGVRPSPVIGHATTSTGTETLDKLLGQGAGLALGNSLLIEEEGTTEFARSLLSCYAAEGVLQGHTVFVVGPEGALTLPGVAEEGRKRIKASTSVESDKMKIAWRYERLGAFENKERGGFALCIDCHHFYDYTYCSAFLDPLLMSCQVFPNSSCQ